MPYIADVNIPPDSLLDLKKYGDVFFSADFLDIYKPVNSHPDIQIHFISNELAYSLKECYLYYKDILPQNITLKAIEEEVGYKYPSNTLLNIAVFGKNVVCNTKFSSKEVLSYYEKNDYRIINVKQGYAKCNICIVSENSIITEDLGIANKLSLYEDINVCYIKSGSVNLESFEYGFIGGASGLLDKNTLGFYGKLSKHVEFEKISEFLSHNNVKHIELGDGGLSDYGSIIKF